MGRWPRLLVAVAVLLAVPGDAPVAQYGTPAPPEAAPPAQSAAEPPAVTEEPAQPSPEQRIVAPPQRSAEVAPEQRVVPPPQQPERVAPQPLPQQSREEQAQRQPKQLTPEQEEIERLQRQVAELQRRVDALTSSAQQDIEQLEALRQEQAQVADRGRELEEGRLQRAEWFGQARAALHRADFVLLGGSTEVEELVGSAYDLLLQATEAADALGNGEEAALGRSALGYVSMASSALEQRDVYGARIAVFSAAQQASAALTAAQGYSQPLYRQGP